MDNMQQNTPEWLQMRKNKIGASDAPVIMEVSPWKTPYQLWEEKNDLAPKRAESSSMRRGLDLEESARLELEKMTGIFFLPRIKQHTSFSWMIASLDGIDAESKHIAEIKCPGAVDHQKALHGQIPEKYFPQLQHQLEVCELDMSYYFSFDGSSGAIVKVYRDDKYIKKMLEKEQAFWQCLQEFMPPKMTARDFEVKTDEAWACQAIEWTKINEQLRILEQKEEALRKSLIAMSNNKNSMGSGVKVSRFIRKGNIDYTSIPELKEVNLEVYRKKPTEFWKITSS